MKVRGISPSRRLVMDESRMNAKHTPLAPQRATLGKKRFVEHASDARCKKNDVDKRARSVLLFEQGAKKQDVGHV
jgi:hypothetical protein